MKDKRMRPDIVFCMELQQFFFCGLRHETELDCDKNGELRWRAFTVITHKTLTVASDSRKRQMMQKQKLFFDDIAAKI